MQFRCEALTGRCSGFRPDSAQIKMSFTWVALGILSHLNLGVAYDQLNLSMRYLRFAAGGQLHLAQVAADATLLHQR